MAANLLSLTLQADKHTAADRGAATDKGAKAVLIMFLNISTSLELSRLSSVSKLIDVVDIVSSRTGQ